MGKKLISILLVLAIGSTLLPGVTILTSATETTALESATTMTAWAEGGYTDLETKVLTINNTDDFKAFQTALAIDNKTFGGYTVCLTADIDLNPHWNSRVNLAWGSDGNLLTANDGVYQSAEDVGESGYKLPGTNAAGKIFNGTFDGMGHSISGLYLSMNAGNAASLFGKTTGTNTVIKNLAVLDSYFQNGVSTDKVKPLAGLLTIIEAGAKATISNCYVDVDLRAMINISGAKQGQQGGLVGYCQGELVVEDTVYAGSITASNSKSGGRLDQIGGIVGYVVGTQAAPVNVTVNNYVFTGSIYSKDQRISGGIGRSEGYANITMTNCLYLGKVRASTNAGAFHGSLVVQGTTVVQNVTMTDCYLNGNVVIGGTQYNQLINPVGTANSPSSITILVNGTTKYSYRHDGTTVTTTGAIRSADYKIKETAAETLAMPIGGSGKTLGDVYTDNDGTIVPTKLYELFKLDSPVISTDPASANYDKEETATALTVEVTGKGALSYQWYCDGGAIDGATEATYTPATTQAGNYDYTCKVTVNRSGMPGFSASAVSNAATIHVHDWTPGTCTTPKTCNVQNCPVIVDAPDHAFDNDCTTADKCANCEIYAIAAAAHAYTNDHDTDCNTEGCSATREVIHTESTDWSSDDTGHWHVCTGCDHTYTVNAHTDSDTDELCDECGFDMSCHHTQLTKFTGTAATCTQNGKLTYWKCNDCGALLDAETDGNEISQIGTVIPAWHTSISENYFSNGTDHWKVCTACNEKLYVAAHTYSNASDTTCVCGHRRELVSLDSVITVSQWIKNGKPGNVKNVKITNLDDFKAFMTELKNGTTAVLNAAYEIRTNGNVAFDGITIYLTTNLDLNKGWTNDFDLKWNKAGKLTDKTAVTAPENKFNPSGQRIFGGMFDGQGHTISGLFIDQKKNAAAQSFFGVAHANSAFTVGVRNLTVKNSYIEGTNVGMGSFFTGVTAGTNVAISNCYVDVDLVSRFAGDERTSLMIGGLVGAVAGNVTIDSTTYAGSIWADNVRNLDYREVGGAIGCVKGGSNAATEKTVMLNNFTFKGKIYWLNGQRVGLFIGRIDNQARVSMVDSVSRGKLLVVSGLYTGGLCNNIVAAAAGTVTNVVIDNCYYLPGHVLSGGVLKEQTWIYNALHSGASAFPYGGFGAVSNNASTKGTAMVYVVSDMGTDWSKNLCLQKQLNPDTGDVAGLGFGLAVVMMLVSAMAIVILLPKKFSRK